MIIRFILMHDIGVRRRTPVILNRVRQLLSETCASGRVRCDNDIALVSEDLGVPAGTPAVAPGTLGAAVDEEAERVLLGLVEVFGVNNP